MHGARGALSSPGLPDVVTVPARQGLEAVDILRRGTGDRVGPVLHDDDCDTLGFLVPAGTADAWDVPGSTCTQTDGSATAPAAPEPAGRGRRLAAAARRRRAGHGPRGAAGRARRGRATAPGGGQLQVSPGTGPRR